MKKKKFNVSHGELSPLRKELILKFLLGGGNWLELNSIEERCGAVLFWNVTDAASLIIKNIEDSDKFASVVSGTNDKAKIEEINDLLYGVVLEEAEGVALQDCFKDILDELCRDSENFQS